MNRNFQFQVLVCDDEPFLRAQVPAFMAKYFPRTRVAFMECSRLEEVSRLLEEPGFRCDLAVTDMNFENTGGGSEDGLKVLRLVRQVSPEAEVIIVTQYEYGSETVAKAHREGMFDWIKKGRGEETECFAQCPRCATPAEPGALDAGFPDCRVCGTPLKKIWFEMLQALNRVFKTAAAQRAYAFEHETRSYYQTRSLEANLTRWAEADLRNFQPPEDSVFYGIIYESKAMHDVVAVIRQHALHNEVILIRGERGTGKEVVVNAIGAERTTQGKNGRIEAVNCSAVPGNIIEAELFGTERGAYTDARNRPGKFEAAEGAVLFLDEIGELPLGLQPKLLRVLEGHAFTRLGGNRQIRPRCKVVCATNRDLDEMVTTGAFRPDLLDRVDRFRIVLPPLRERPEEIPLLCCYLVAKLNHDIGTDVRGISLGALRALSSHDWPGNVRELENVLARVVHNVKSGVVEEGDVEGQLRAKTPMVGTKNEEPSGDWLWEQIRSGVISKRLSDLQREFGSPRTVAALRCAIRGLGGRFPPDSECRRLFGGMTYAAFKQWLNRQGLALEDLK